MNPLQDLSADLIFELAVLSDLTAFIPGASGFGMLAAPLVLGAVLWAGHRRLPEGARLNGAGQVMLTAIGLAGAGLVAGFFSGSSGLMGWMWPEAAHHTGALLMTLCGVTMLAGGFLRLCGERGWLVQLTAGALLTGAGALGLKGLEVMAFSHNDYALASVVVPMNRAAMGIAGLYLAGALLVALKMPRRLAPFSAVLTVLGLVVLVSGWSLEYAAGSSGRSLQRITLTDAPELIDQESVSEERTWPNYYGRSLATIDVTLVE
ncbi:MAG: hypothetical protein ACI8RZ_005319 [Myxococcota bacterium]|jgi:hypothetical protein